MKNRLRSMVFALLLVALALNLGCSQSVSAVSVTVMAVAPPRPNDCALQTRQIPVTSMDFHTKYQMLGAISLGERGMQNPFSERYLRVVRPRACRMGGTILTLILHSMSTSAMGSSSGTVYAVLRERPAFGSRGSKPAGPGPTRLSF